MGEKGGAKSSNASSFCGLGGGVGYQCTLLHAAHCTGWQPGKAQRCCGNIVDWSGLKLLRAGPPSEFFVRPAPVAFFFSHADAFFILPSHVVSSFSLPVLRQCLFSDLPLIFRSRASCVGRHVETRLSTVARSSRRHQMHTDGREINGFCTWKKIDTTSWLDFQHPSVYFRRCSPPSAPPEAAEPFSCCSRNLLNEGGEKGRNHAKISRIIAIFY